MVGEGFRVDYSSALGASATPLTLLLGQLALWRAWQSRVIVAVVAARSAAWFVRLTRALGATTAVSSFLVILLYWVLVWPAGLGNVPVGAACDASQTTAVIATLGNPARLNCLKTKIVPALAKSMAMREVVVLWQDPTKPTPSISLARVVRMPNSSLNNRYRVPLLATCSAFLLDDDHMCDQKCVDSLWPSWNHAYFAAIASGCKQPDEPRRRRADASCRM